VQIFAPYWSNTWEAFLKTDRRRSTAYASTLADPEQDNEIVGGTLIVWPR
jgi:hypothetical protein